jgi:hypothetical protein
LLCLNGEYQEQNGEQITQYHVDVLDDEQMDIMCIFSFYMGTPTSSSASRFAFLHCCGTSANSSALADKS